MSQADARFNLQQLSAINKLELIGQLWDSLPDSPAAIPMPEWHQRELEQRLAAADANPSAAIPWDDVKNRLRPRP
jgi:putative addiction module component (TIGR02574 family)